MELFLIRHGESEANVDPALSVTRADHAIALSAAGREQAAAAGRLLADHLADDGRPRGRRRGDRRLRVWSSPYRRTRETAAAVLDALASSEDRHRLEVDYREHINLCEQQFGLFDGVSDEDLLARFPAEAAHYRKCVAQEGKFWARMPLGESRFDVAVRVHQAFGTFHRDAARRGIERIVAICHGVTLRAIVMQWLHLPYEWFDAEPNPRNCAIRHISQREDLGYLLPGGRHELPENAFSRSPGTRPTRT